MRTTPQTFLVTTCVSVLLSSGLLSHGAVASPPTLPPYLTVDDLLKLQLIGNGVSVANRWFIWEQTPPADSISNYSLSQTAGLGLHVSYPGLNGANLISFDISNAAAGPAYFTPPDRGGSAWLDGVSPNGQIVAYTTFRAGRFDFHLRDLERRNETIVPVAIRTTFVGRVPPMWLDDDHVVVSVTDEGQPPSVHERNTLNNRQSAMFERFSRGKDPAVGIYESRTDGGGGEQLPGRLMQINVRTGKVRLIGKGQFSELHASADGKKIAARRELTQRQPRSLADDPGEGVFLSDVLVFDLTANSSRPKRYLELPEDTNWRSATGIKGGISGDVDPQMPEPLSETGNYQTRLVIASMTMGGPTLVKINNDAGTSIAIESPDGQRQVISRLNGHLAVKKKPRVSQITYPLNTINGRREAMSCIYLPPNYRSDRRYPVIVNMYVENTCMPKLFGAAVPSLPVGDEQILLAAAGYIVISPAMRDSDSVKLGGPADAKIQARTDLMMQAVDALIAQGFADPKRLGLIGMSQGGFTTLFSATQTDRFQAIVSMFGWAEPYSDSFGHHYLYSRYIPEYYPYLGDSGRWSSSGAGGTNLGTSPIENPELYQRVSPLFNSARIKSPILLIHGEYDSGVTTYEMMFTALRRQRKEARLLLYWGEGHGLSSPANMRHMNQSILDWFDRHLKVVRDSKGEIRWDGKVLRAPGQKLSGRRCRSEASFDSSKRAFTEAVQHAVRYQSGPL